MELRGEYRIAAPRARVWAMLNDADVLRGILRAIDRAQNPDSAESRHISLRGFSWIVEPSEGGVVIAVEIPMGAAVAGPFEADQQQLDALITRTLKRQTFTPLVPPSQRVH